MFKKSKPEATDLEKAIASVLSEMEGYSAADAEYIVMNKQLSKLYKLKAQDKPDRLKPDTVALIAGNIAIAVLVLHFEKTGVVTTKLLSFLAKAR